MCTCVLVHVLCRMASPLYTWQPRRITWRWCGSFWRTTPARVWPLRYCTCVYLFLILCVCSHVHASPVSTSLQSHRYSMSPCIFSASVMYGLYICCTNHLHLLSSSVSFLLLSSLPHSLCICPSLRLFLRLSVLSCPFCLTFSLSASLSFHHPPLTAPSPLPLLPHFPSLHEGLGRASLIGSVWWWRQSDLEWVTDEVRSARCLSSTAAAAVTALIYVAQPVEPIHTHTYQSLHVHTHASTCTYRDK